MVHTIITTITMMKMVMVVVAAVMVITTMITIMDTAVAVAVVINTIMITDTVMAAVVVAVTNLNLEIKLETKKGAVTECGKTAFCYSPFLYIYIYHSWLSYKTIYLNFTRHKS